MSAAPRVVWVSFAPLEKTARGATSAIASVRYRLAIPAAALGGGSKVTYLAPGANRRTLQERFEGADAVVLGKLLAAPENFAGDAVRVLELIAALRARGTKVLADYSDDHFDDPHRGDAYRSIARAVDRIVASTPALAEVVRSHTGVSVGVITDPVEGQRGEPRAPRGTAMRLLWYGHPSNLDTLSYGVPQIVAAGLAHTLTVMTAPGAGAEELGVRFRPWSTASLWRELSECDAVVIPSNAHDPRKAVKSPNRFLEGMWAGRLVVAHPLPAYQALAAYGWVGEDLGEGLRWGCAHPDAVSERVRLGQEAIARDFTPTAIAARWRAEILLAIEKQ